MKNNPKISVVIPVYNTKKYLKNCLDSVLNQGYENIEIILINDGSTDGSKEICEKYSDKDKRIKVFHQKNLGASVARNKGIYNATGEYLMFLDSDDFWVENCLKKIIEKILKLEEKVDVVFLNSAVIKSDGNLTQFKGYEFSLIGKKQLYPYIAKQDKVCVSACLKVLRKNLFENKKLYFKEGILAEDIDWFFNLILTANSFYAISENFYCYRIRKNSASREISEKRIKDYLYILEKWSNYIKTSSFTSKEKKYLFFMIGYEYEILLGVINNFRKDIILKYKERIKNLYWLLEHRDKNRSRLIKFFNQIFGFDVTCKLINLYLKIRSI